MWRSKTKKERAASPLTDAAALWLAKRIVAAQERIVRVLQRWERRCTVREKKAVLIAFCVCCSLYCMMLLMGTLLPKKLPAPFFRLISITPFAQPPPGTYHGQLRKAANGKAFNNQKQ